MLIIEASEAKEITNDALNFNKTLEMVFLKIRQEAALGRNSFTLPPDTHPELRNRLVKRLESFGYKFEEGGQKITW